MGKPGIAGLSCLMAGDTFSTSGAGMQEIRLSIPARAEYVHVLRSVTAGVAAMLSFTYDDIEDLRLAVDEACAYLLAGGGEPGALEMHIRSARESLEIIATLDGSGPPRTDNQATVMW